MSDHPMRENIMEAANNNHNQPENCNNSLSNHVQDHIKNQSLNSIEEAKAFVRGPMNDASQELLNEAEQVIVNSEHQINEEHIYPTN